MNGHYKTAKILSKLLDSQFKIGPFSFGLDPILGLFWGGGDVIAFILALYIVWIGFQMNVPGSKLGLMIWYIVTDFLLGLIPVAGQLADFGYKANEKNLKIIEQYGRVGVVEGQFS